MDKRKEALIKAHKTVVWIKQCVRKDEADNTTLSDLFCELEELGKGLETLVEAFAPGRSERDFHGQMTVAEFWDAANKKDDMEIVAEAMKAGCRKTPQIVEWIKQKYGVAMPPRHVSIAKTTLEIQLLQSRTNETV